MLEQDIEDGDATHETSIPKLFFVEHCFLVMLISTLRENRIFT